MQELRQKHQEETGMKSIVSTILSGAALAATALLYTFPAAAQESSFGPADAKETYYWISNKANLPLFVQYDYVGMKRIAEELGVKVIVAGPTDFDVPGFISAVDQVCAQKPSGVSVVGGWDPSLTESVKKCMEQGVPTVVDDGDLPDSGRLSYIGTNWTQVGVAQAKKLMEMLPNGGKIASMSIINAGNMREAVAGFKAYVEANGGGKYTIVANEDDGGDAQKAAQVTAAILAANPDIAGLAGFDSESGAGIVTALREAGKNPGDIKVTAMEQTPDFFKSAKEGWGRRHRRAEPRTVHLLRGEDAARLQHQHAEVGRPDFGRRRPPDPGLARHGRYPDHQGQCRQGAHGTEREVTGHSDRGALFRGSSSVRRRHLPAAGQPSNEE
jgi:ribose transport system substrate-binding protein